MLVRSFEQNSQLHPQKWIMRGVNINWSVRRSSWVDNETFPCSPLFLIAGSSFSISSTSQNVGADGESALELRAVVPDYVRCTVGSRVSCDKLECFIGAEVKVRAVDGDLERVNLLELRKKGRGRNCCWGKGKNSAPKIHLSSWSTANPDHVYQRRVYH